MLRDENNRSGNTDPSGASDFGRGDGCRSTVGYLASSYLWERLGRYSEGVSSTGIHTRALKPDEVSEDLQEVMEKLEGGGGLGHYTLVTYRKQQIEAVRVTHPPRNDLYGDVFGDIFRRLNGRGIPVFVEPEGKGLGHFIVEKFGTSNTEAAFFISPNANNPAVRRSLRNMHDLIIHPEEFQQGCPPFPTGSSVSWREWSPGIPWKARKSACFAWLPPCPQS